MIRKIKGFIYSWYPSSTRPFHGKRRKGVFYRYVDREVLECQMEQDRIFWSKLLHPEKRGRFAEIGGDGVIGSHTLGLEMLHGWEGTIWVPKPIPRARAEETRNCRVQNASGDLKFAKPLDLVAIHRPEEFVEFWDEIEAGRLVAKWVIVENREPEPHWCRLLEKAGYRLRFYFHDDEYYEHFSSGSI